MSDSNEIHLRMHYPECPNQDGITPWYAVVNDKGCDHCDPIHIASQDRSDDDQTNS